MLSLKSCNVFTSKVTVSLCCFKEVLEFRLVVLENCDLLLQLFIFIQCILVLLLDWVLIGETAVLLRGSRWQRSEKPMRVSAPWSKG